MTDQTYKLLALLMVIVCQAISVYLHSWTLWLISVAILAVLQVKQYYPRE